MSALLDRAPPFHSSPAPIQIKHKVICPVSGFPDRLTEMNARNFLETVTQKCPAYSTPLSDCALASLRSPADLNEKLDYLTDSEIEDLVRRHFLCVCRQKGCES